MTIIDIEQGSEAWHEIRAGRITGTRFKTLMSKENTQGYKDLIIELACETITGIKDDSYSNSLMERGSEMEAEARAKYEIELDAEVHEVGFCLMDGYEDWVGVSPDGLVNGNGMVEIKCPMMKTHMKYIQANQLPAEYRHQVQGQLFTTGREYCDFMSYYPNMKPFILRVYPDLELHASYKIEIEKAIQLVKKQIELYNQYNYDEIQE